MTEPSTRPANGWAARSSTAGTCRELDELKRGLMRKFADAVTVDPPAVR